MELVFGFSRGATSPHIIEFSGYETHQAMADQLVKALCAKPIGYYPNERGIVRCLSDILHDSPTTWARRLLKAVRLAAPGCSWKPGNELVSDCIKASLEASLDCNGRNPQYQDIKLRYQKCHVAQQFGRVKWYKDSLQGFAKNYLVDDKGKALELTNGQLRSIYEKLRLALGDLRELSQLTLKVCNGDATDAREVFPAVYRSVPPDHASDTQSGSGAYPCIGGSCMRHRSDFWGIPGVDISMHPVQVYCTPDIALAWLEDASGYVWARGLVSVKDPDEPRVARIYRTSPLDADNRNAFASAVQAKFESLLKAHYGADLVFSPGHALEGCLAAPIALGDDKYLMPYVDGEAYYVNLGTSTFETEGELECLKHYPPVVRAGGDLTCRCCDGDITEDNSMTTPSGALYCSECFHDRYFYCQRCDDTYSREEEVPTDNGCYCLGCAEHMGIRECCDCRSCSENTVETEGDYVCESCLDAYYSSCDGCGEFFRATSDSAVEFCGADGNYYCPECMPEEEPEEETMEVTND